MSNIGIIKLHVEVDFDKLIGSEEELATLMKFTGEKSVEGVEKNYLQTVLRDIVSTIDKKTHIQFDAKGDVMSKEDILAQSQAMQEEQAKSDDMMGQLGFNDAPPVKAVEGVVAQLEELRNGEQEYTMSPLYLIDYNIEKVENNFGGNVRKLYINARHMEKFAQEVIKHAPQHATIVKTLENNVPISISHYRDCEVKLIEEHILTDYCIEYLNSVSVLDFHYFA